MRSKYWYYEHSVQSADTHAYWYRGMFRELRGGRDPHSLREDFCGTFSLCCGWTALGPEYTAHGVDLDPEPIAYGRKTHWRKLKPARQRRVKVTRGDVLTVRVPAVDLIVAGNFSFYTFKRRELLKRYFRAALRGLRPGGAFILEMAGGPGMIKTMREPRPIYLRGKRAFTYVWHQRSFDPIRGEGQYAIDFLLPGGKRLTSAFEYDWRVWTIPEVREILAEAGFTDSRVYWDVSKSDNADDEYAFAETGDNAEAWVSYVIGLKG